MSSIRAAYVWLQDPECAHKRLVETLVLTRAYAISMPQSAAGPSVGLTFGTGRLSIANLLDARHEIDEPKMMRWASCAADALFGEGNWTHGERAEIIRHVVHAYTTLMALPLAEQPPEESMDEIAARFGVHLRIDGKTVVDAR